MEAEQPIEKPKKTKKKKPSRSVETMFRSTMSNHIRLSEMADRKAGLMVSVNSIILTIMTSFMVHEFGTKPNLLLPTCVLIIVCLLTITFALLSTKPSVKPPHTNHEKLDLLFFGDYLSLSKENYKEAMKEMMLSDGQLFDSLIENIYSQGKVIGRKYRLLKIAYTIFIIGFPLVFLLYLIVLYYNPFTITPPP